MKHRVYYMRPEYFPEFIMGDVLPSVANLSTTHVELRTVDLPSLDAVYDEQQAHNWGKDIPATNRLLGEKGLAHTSMSVGDVIEVVDTGEFFAVASVGFTQLAQG